MLRIVNTPNKILTTPVQPVKTIDNNIIKLVAEMEKTLDAQVDPQGVGLAATQVGVGLALFIIKPDPDGKAKAFINPKIIKHESLNTQPSTLNTKHSSQKEKKKKEGTKLEGCLSIPRIWGPVKRAGKVLVQYQDLAGKTHEKWFSGFEAIIIQHEVDHLQGILFTQRSLEQNAPLYEEKDGELEKVDIV